MPAEFPSSTPSALEGGPIPTGTDNTTSSTTAGRKAASSTATSSSTSGDTMNRVVQGAHDTIDRLAERAAPHVERLKGSLSEGNSLLGERADQLSQLSDEWAESLRTTVREHPVAAVATALAVGMLIARITR